MVGRHRPYIGRKTRRGTLVGLVTLLAAIGLGGATASARGKRARASRASALRFGIYPGGGAGTIGPGATPKPEDPAKRLAALERLRSGHRFVLHLYANYTGSLGASAAAQVGQEIGQYTAAGFEVELVLCYRPAGGGSPADIAWFARFVGDTVSSLGSKVVSLQVTNEANVAGSAGATDGSYAHAPDALVAGVIAAKQRTRALRLHGLDVGFNWAYATDRGEASFWRYLRRHGGVAFARAVDWVGLDVYPGTWGPRIAGQLGQGSSTMMRQALRDLRSRYMMLAGLPRQVAIHISENGYPTGPGRTPAMQETVMRHAIGTVESLRARYHVTDYRWFDLRDASSASRSFEDQYGLLYDDYTPKPAFGLYRQLIARYSRR